MANIKINTLKADIEDRADNAVLGAQLTDAMRQKLITTRRLNRAMTQAYFLFVKDADPAALQQLTKQVDLAQDPNVPAIEGLKAYLWPEDAYQERFDGGIVAFNIDGQERLLRENTPLESVRMQAQNVFYGGDQRVFALDQQQKRIYIPENVVAKARVIRAPQVVQLESEGFFEVTAFPGGTVDVTVTVGSLTGTETFAPITSNTVAATNLAAAINLVDDNGTLLATAVADGTRVYVKSLTNTAAVVSLSSYTGFTPSTPISVNATGSYDLPISDVYNESLSLLAFAELTKMGQNPNNAGIIGQQVPVSGAVLEQE